MAPDVNNVLKFLTHLFKVEHLGYSSINTARSAISSFLSGSEKIGEHFRICRFMKGIYNLKPVIPKNIIIWDTKLVLDFLEKWHPAKNLSLRQLSIKTVILCLLVSGQRGQTIWLMDTRNMVFDKDSVKCSIGDPLKTSDPQNHISELCFKEYTINKALCVRHYLCQYRQRTKNLRGGEAHGFFISTLPPHLPIARATLSSWVKDGLKRSGVDTTRFTPHSTRSASTSKARTEAGVSLASILKTAGWKNSSTFARFYNKKIEKQGWNVNALL